MAYQASSYPDDVDRWAIVVGISEHRHARLNLKYADRDAEEFYKLIQTASGGGYERDHITYLTNRDATTATISRALRSFLKKPAREDIVLLYFACHAAPDPDRPGVVYLITHDTDPDDISGTALPMREIELSLRENLHAERVVILADTCHSASIAGGIGRRDAANDPGIVNSYLKHLSSSQAGLALLTSSEANETSQEDARWGDGHGVFTYFLLRGLRGEADRTNDGVVTVGELFDYVRESVWRATDNQQHPSLGTDRFDRNLPMAITGGTASHEHYQLGRHLYELGQLLDDHGRLASANRHFRAALRLSRQAGVGLPDASVWLGRSLMTLGRFMDAAGVLAKAVRQGATEASLYLGLSQSALGRYNEAAATLQGFLEAHPADDNAAWLSAYVRLLKTIEHSRKHALLIGIGEYAEGQFYLRGPATDVALMEGLLRKLGFGDADIVMLKDEAATYSGILAALNRLKEEVVPGDIVVIHFSGQGNRQDIGIEAPFLMTYDGVYGVKSEGSDANDVTRNLIGVLELHSLVDAIPTDRKTLIIDSDSNSHFLSLVMAARSYAVMLASSPGHQTYEQSFEHEGTEVFAGRFSYSLAQHLAKADIDRTYGAILAAVRAEVDRPDARQTPSFVGDPNRVFLDGAGDVYLDGFTFSQRANYAALADESLRQLRSRFRERIAAPFPQIHYSLGRAFSERRFYVEAIEEFQLAVRERTGGHLEASLALAVAHLEMGHYAGALTDLQTCLGSVETDMPDDEAARVRASQLQRAIDLTARLAGGVKHALLVGIDEHGDEGATTLPGAMDDLNDLRLVLLDRYGFREENVTVLLGRAATRSAILAAFGELVRKAKTDVALFYFAGHGASAEVRAPNLRCGDSQESGVAIIELQELSAKAGRGTNLVTIVDVDFSDQQFDRQGVRTVLEGPGRDPRLHDLALRRQSTFPESLGIGEYTIYDPSIAATAGPGRSMTLTHALLKHLMEATPDRLTYSELSRDPFLIYVVGDDLREAVFNNRVLLDDVRATLAKIEHEPRHGLTRLLRRVIERRGGQDPESHLNLGIAHAALGEYPEGIEALEGAIAQRREYFEARYHLGRVLYESGSDFERAASELRQVIQDDPTHVRAQYYFAQSLRALVEREILVEAEEALRVYLGQGAPLGRTVEVEAFLSRRAAGRLWS